MLQELEYPDSNLVDEICQGFKLSGWLPKSNIFPQALKRPARSMDAVRNMAKSLNKNIAKQLASHTDEDLAAEVWALTKEFVFPSNAFMAFARSFNKFVLAGN